MIGYQYLLDVLKPDYILCFSATGEQYGSRSRNSALRFVFHVSVWSYRSKIYTNSLSHVQIL